MNIKKVIIVFGLIVLVGNYSVEDNSIVHAEALSDYTSLEEYPIYEEVILDASGASDGMAEYAIYDIDEDGIRELIVSYGTCEADWINDVYTLEDGLVCMIGSFYGHVGLFAESNGKGIYTVGGRERYEVITKITIQNGKVMEEDIWSGEMKEGEEYYSNENPIVLQNFAEERQKMMAYKLTGTYENKNIDPIYGASVSFYEKNGMDLADVSISKRYRETVKVQEKTGVSIDGTEVFFIRGINGGNIYVEFTSITDADGWYVNPSIYKIRVAAEDGGANLREGPGVEYEKVLPDMIKNGEILTVIDEQTASNGNKWGHAFYKGTEGWIALSQVDIIETYPSEEFLDNDKSSGNESNYKNTEEKNNMSSPFSKLK